MVRSWVSMVVNHVVSGFKVPLADSIAGCNACMMSETCINISIIIMPVHP